MTKSYREKYLSKLEEMTKLLNRLLKEDKVKVEDLPALLAESYLNYDELLDQYKELVETAQEFDLAVKVFGAEQTRDGARFSLAAKKSLLKVFEETGSEPARRLSTGLRLIRQEAARRAADARHSKPGGSRDKQKNIREIWATGDYSSRDNCAEQVHESLGMSFPAARKALRNTPKP